MENDALRALYRRTEQLTLVILIVSLPLFGVVYLFHNSGSINKDLPQLPVFAQGVLLGLGFLLLGLHYALFHQKIKQTFSLDNLLDKVEGYCAATRQRFWFLFLVSVLSSLGLLFSGNPGFVVVFALALVFFSLGKPSPDRMARLMKLKKEDRELLREISRPA
jgi:protein-S-isoprenylcysteine O-methyltransferase Ste14